MRVTMILDSTTPWVSGIWYHRNKTPAEALGTRGHFVKQYTITTGLPNQKMIDETDVVMFGRTYPQGYDPVAWMKEFKKHGKRIIFDIDDDFWEVAKDNPSVLISNALKDQYEALIKNCDAVTTPSTVLAKKIKKHFNKPVFICPNGINYDEYKEREHLERDEIFVGYMGASSHWEDLTFVLDVLNDLSVKHGFYFYLYGLTSGSFEGEYYNVKKMLDFNLMPEKREYMKSILKFYDGVKSLRMLHKPFCPVEIHPMILQSLDLDIGIAPLTDTKFNRAKSALKFFEYAATGTVTLASDIPPYKGECNYTAKNTYKDWYKKLEKLIVDKKFRDETQRKQSEYVKKHYSVEAIALAWELAFQKPSKGPRILNQLRLR